MDRFSSKVLKFIRKEKLIEPGDRVVVGFSGGADSMALLAFLSSAKELLGTELLAVHVNHNLRGEEAGRDERFCISEAAKLRVEIRTEKVYVREFAAENHLSVEEAARILRYEAIREKGREFFGEGFLIATAHHSEDQAETILLNMLRGTGLKGLCGMKKRRGDIVRPFLTVGKDEILSYLAHRGIAYVTDSSNEDNDYARNAVRNVIIPAMKESVNKKAPQHITAAGEKLREADEYIREKARVFVSDYSALTETKEGSSLSLCSERLKEEAKIFRIYVIIEGLSTLDVPLKDWGEKHFEDIDALLFKGKGAHLDLPGDVTAENIYHDTLIKRNIPAGKYGREAKRASEKGKLWTTLSAH